MPKILVLAHGQSQLRFWYLGNETVEAGLSATPTGKNYFVASLQARLPGWLVVSENSGAANTRFVDDWVIPENAGDAAFTANATTFFDLVTAALAAHPDTTHVVVLHFVQTQDWKDNLADSAYVARYLASMKKWETKLGSLLGALPWIWGYAHIGERNSSVDPDNITDARRLINAVAGLEKHPLVAAGDRINRFRIVAMPGLWRSSRTTSNAAADTPSGTDGDFTHQGVSGSRRIAHELAHEVARWVGGTAESTRGHPRCVGAWKAGANTVRARFMITPGKVLVNPVASLLPVQISAQVIGNNAGESLGPTYETITAVTVDNSKAALGIAELVITTSAPANVGSFLQLAADFQDYSNVGSALPASQRRLAFLYEDPSPGAALNVAADFSDLASAYVPMPVAALHNIPIRAGDPDVTALSDYAENAAMTALMTGTRYVALGTGSTDSSFTEFAGGSYARVGASFTVAGSQASNAGTLTFPAPTADWGTATHFAVFDAASAGNMLWHAPLSAPVAIANGASAPQIAAGQLVLSLD